MTKRKVEGNVPETKKLGEGQNGKDAEERDSIVNKTDEEEEGSANKEDNLT